MRIFICLKDSLHFIVLTKELSFNDGDSSFVCFTKELIRYEAFTNY